MKSCPSYLNLYDKAILKERIDTAFKLLEECCICPHKCKVNRIKNQKGICKVGLKPIVCSYMPHHGEEPVISGNNGSGTIFFSFCNLKCVYCQNFQFSQLGEGAQVTYEELADKMIALQNMGCHNINFVTPTHVMPQILKSLYLAIEKGLKIPVVYNTSGYELPEVIKLLEGIVDIYLVDMRYSNKEYSKKFSSAADYPFYNQESLKEMYRQTGEAEFDDAGIIKKGIIIRHLVLPGNISGTKEIAEFISTKLSNKIYISLMSQYCPYHKAHNYPEISRRITKEEYEQAINYLKEFKLENGWIQESYGLERMAGINIKKNI